MSQSTSTFTIYNFLVGDRSVRLQESNFNLARLDLLFELLGILFLLLSECRYFCELLLLEFFLGIDLGLKSQFLLPQSLQQLLSHYNLFVLKLKEFIKVEAETDIVKLGVAEVTDTILLFCVFAKELLIGAACCTHGKPALLAEEVTITHPKDGHHTKRLLAYITIVLFCSLLSMSGPSIWKSILLVHFFLF